jgi:hypothetical protein
MSAFNSSWLDAQRGGGGGGGGGSARQKKKSDGENLFAKSWAFYFGGGASSSSSSSAIELASLNGSKNNASDAADGDDDERSHGVCALLLSLLLLLALFLYYRFFPLNPRRLDRLTAPFLPLVLPMMANTLNKQPMISVFGVSRGAGGHVLWRPVQGLRHAARCIGLLFLPGIFLLAHGRALSRQIRAVVYARIGALHGLVRVPAWAKSAPRWHGVQGQTALLSCLRHVPVSHHLQLHRGEELPHDAGQRRFPNRGVDVVRGQLSPWRAVWDEDLHDDVFEGREKYGGALLVSRVGDLQVLLSPN